MRARPFLFFRAAAGLAAGLILLAGGCVTTEPDPTPPAPVTIRGVPAPARPPPAARPPVAVRAPVAARPPAPTPPAPRGTTNAPAARAPSPPATPRPPGADAPGVYVAPTPALQTGLGFRDILALQTLLDRRNFSPGCISGVYDEHTVHAVQAWQESVGLPPSGRFDTNLWARLGPPATALTRRRIVAADREGLTAIPDDWNARAALANMSHQTVQERLAEEAHCTEALLRELNPAAAWPDPPEGAALTVPNPRPFRLRPAARVEISLHRRRVRVYGDDGKLIALFPCSIARDKEKRPVGELHVGIAAKDPNYTFDPELFYENPAEHKLDRRLLIPPGPNNPVGTAWIGLDRPGYGIHGTPLPEEIGAAASHGCFRLANWNARKLLDMVQLGTPVVVAE